MRHLFNRFYKPMGISETLREALLALRPEIWEYSRRKSRIKRIIIRYRTILEIEECRFINLTSDEGYSRSHFKAIVPPKEDVIVTELMRSK
jgi:hypothetical protein